MLRKHFFSFFLILLSAVTGFAQNDSSSHLRVSLLTCGTGPQIWATFGHTAIRIIDSVRKSDRVYNYGTFDGFQDGFELKFMRGKLLYYISESGFGEFMEEYVYMHRSVIEQELNLTDREKIHFRAYMEENMRPENRYYKYDFLFDNCATRIRDIFPGVLGKDFHFSRALPEKSTLTFRQIINSYLYRDHFERLGINILFGRQVDRVMSNEDVMFLPDYLLAGVANAKVKDRKIAKEAAVILEAGGQPGGGINTAFLLTLALAFLTIAGISLKQLRGLGNLMSFLLLLITGLLGIVILLMWFGTDHQCCRDNLNILWALPTNLIVAFIHKRGKVRYASVGIVLIFVSLLLHIMHIQELPLLEVGPLLLALLFVFGNIYRNGRKIRAGVNAFQG